MFVDKTGLHCFMLTGHEIFYNYFDSDQVYNVPIESIRGTQVAFKSIDILKFDENEPNFFELLLGSEDGHLFHGVFETQKHNGELSAVEPFKVVV